MRSFLLLPFLFFSVKSKQYQGPSPFLTLDNSGNYSLKHLPACQESSELLCERVTNVDVKVLLDAPNVLLPDGTVLKRDKENENEPDGGVFVSFVGEDEDLTADFVVFDGQNGKIAHADGIVRLPNGDTFELEFCQSRCSSPQDHVWMKFVWAGRYKEGDDTFLPPDDDLANDDDDDDRAITEQDRQDPYDISIMVYYTKEFKARRPDVSGFIDQAISETNQGLTNSKVNIRVHLHCMEEAENLVEVRDEGSMLRTFRSFKGSVDDLRQTADVAMLLVSNLGPRACGVAYFNSPSNTVGIVDIRCALGYFSFGHEVFHMFGAHHDQDAGGRPPGTGYQIEGTRKRTVLAYRHRNHPTRVNYYSTSDTSVTVDGHKVGIAGQADNRSVMEKNAFRIQTQGDESGKCDVDSGGGGSNVTPVNGGWSSWGAYSACSVTCGTGSRTRRRTCSNPAPANGGSSCRGSSSQTSRCNNGACPDAPVNGGWSRWDSWGSCPVTCGSGIRRRRRECNNPAPANGGRECPGRDVANRWCSGGSRCPSTDAGSTGNVEATNGKWSNWSAWSACSATCGGGIKLRTRSCDNPAPSNGGRDCSGINKVELKCKAQECEEGNNSENQSCNDASAFCTRSSATYCNVAIIKRMCRKTCGEC